MEPTSVLIFTDTKEQASQGNVSRIQMDEAAGLNKVFWFKTFSAYSNLHLKKTWSIFFFFLLGVVKEESNLIKKNINSKHLSNEILKYIQNKQIIIIL